MQKVNYNHYNSIRIKNLEFAKVEKGKVYYLYADINSSSFSAKDNPNKIPPIITHKMLI